MYLSATAAEIFQLFENFPRLFFLHFHIWKTIDQTNTLEETSGESAKGN